MARPRKGTLEVWYDCFSDMPLEDQAAALKILEQVHRLAVREAKRPISMMVSAQQLRIDAGDGRAIEVKP